MARIPAAVSNLLDQLARDLPIVIGENLVGLYLYGSLTRRAFNSERSDVDCIAVVRRDLNAAEFKRLREWMALAAKSNPWVLRLQMSVLTRDEILINNSRYCLYQFGKLKRGRSDGNPIIWINVLESGRTLFGPAPKTFVPTITRETFRAALVREVNYIRDELIEKRDSEWRDVPFYRAYATMTLCRILYSHAKGGVVSKPQAVRWALRNLDRKWHPMIVRAFESGPEGAR